MQIFRSPHLNLLSHSAWADAVTDSQPHKTLQDIFPDSGKASTITLEQVFGNDTATIQLGLEANARLKDEQSEEGEAYRTMIQSANRVSPDLSNDPMFRQADEVRSTSYMDAFNKFFKLLYKINPIFFAVTRQHLEHMAGE
ncbi:conjugal transfer mating pair stabilization protein TraN [Azotobacter beijerinckii]|uniref:Conjugal transfer mating pair stabilization protein TraN n=1 Tax=Azotobacter beijerinckii TaxID=170623 RepID=A0A1H7AFH4_9GAMM|nr:hypothetical protein [Azotobacter beijerinckii]SEJ60802.1 conjugal transfer mating pair stabilization protein TraN [Azotobacter beijerinckii]